MAGTGNNYTKIEWGQKFVEGVDVTFKWNTAPNNPTHPRYTWNEVELIRHAGGDLMNEPWQKWDKNKKKKLIKLICKVKGKTYNESKYTNDYKIKISDVRLVAKEILGVEIMTENIKF